jgi:drug/metabolite transporter (DMT)-like permease
MQDVRAPAWKPTVAAPDRGAVFGGVLAMVLFSGNFACARHGLENGLSVADLVLIRYGVSSPLYLVMLLRIGLDHATPGRAAVLTLLGGVPYFLLTAGALSFTSATHGSILNPGGTMVFAPLLAWLVLGERPGAGVLVGVAILAAGLLMIGGEGLLEGGGGRGGAGGGSAWIGDLLLLWSGFDWALFGVLMRRWRLSGLRTACVMGACSVLWLPFHVLIFGLGGIPDAPGAAAIQAAYQGVIVGWLAIILYSRAVAALGPSRGALLPPLVPALGVFWAWLLLGEQVSALQVAGMATVIAGMLVGALWRRERGRRVRPAPTALR